MTLVSKRGGLRGASANRIDKRTENAKRIIQKPKIAFKTDENRRVSCPTVSQHSSHKLSVLTWLLAAPPSCSVPEILAAICLLEYSYRELLLLLIYSMQKFLKQKRPDEQTNSTISKYEAAVTVDSCSSAFLKHLAMTVRMRLLWS